MTVGETIAGAAVARQDAEVLLAHVLGCERAWLLAHPEAAVGGESVAAFERMAARRASGEPLQYVLGAQEFYGLSLRVTTEALIPRPETEHLVEAALLWAAGLEREETLEIADVGTGTGAIAIALATHLAGARFVATDISAGALELARENALRHGCEGQIEFWLGDLLPDGRVLDAVVSNPPYIPVGDAAGMQREVVEHEPHTALFAGADGLDVYRRLIPRAGDALREGGLLAMEIGFGQREAMVRLLGGWAGVRFVEDYAGIARVVLAEKRG